MAVNGGSVLTKYDPANRIRRALEKHNIPHETWAKICGVSTGMLSEFLSGKRTLPAFVDSWEQLLRTVDKFVERMGNIPINWHPRCAAVLKDKLVKFEKNLLLVSVIDLTHGETPDDVAMTASELAGMLDALSRNKELDLKPGEKTDAI